MLVLNKLHEHSLGSGLWVDEGDQGVVNAGPGFSVDHGHAAGAQIGHRSGDIIHAVGDVVDARPLLAEKPREAGIFGCGRDQLKESVAQAGDGDIRVTLRQGDALPLFNAERRAVVGDGRIYVGHDEPDMIN
jgi:hypothetical protein